MANRLSCHSCGSRLAIIQQNKTDENQAHGPDPGRNSTDRRIEPQLELSFTARGDAEKGERNM